jgi:hypothetical protein
MDVTEHKALHAKLYTDYQRVVLSIIRNLETVPPAASIDLENVDRSLTEILNRMVSANNSMQVLMEHGEDSSHDLAAIIRVMYDLHIQHRFILKDPTVHIPAYLEFMRVEQIEFFKMLASSPTQFAKDLIAEASIQQSILSRKKDLRLIAHKFQPPGKTTFRKHWYKGSLADLADEVGCIDEYKIVQSLLSQSIHSSSITLTRDSIIPDYGFLNGGWILLIRTAAENSKYHNIAIAPEEQVIVASAYERLL